MKRPILVRSRSTSGSDGFTLVEIMVALALSLLLLGAVISLFGTVSESISDSRSLLEMADRLRLAEQRLQLDLAGITVTMKPPRNPANNEGYFEYIEGPVGVATMTITKPGGPVSSPLNPAVNSDPSTKDKDVDWTVGDFDDILLFTTRTSGRPFVGKLNGDTIQSEVAEVAWFLRGRTLHRRVLLVAPGANLGAAAQAGFYANYDVSAHLDTTTNKMVANTLADLTRRECRFAHPTDAFPYDVSRWNYTCSLLTDYSPTTVVIPTLPTLQECSASSWTVNTVPSAKSLAELDFWNNAATKRLSDTAFASGGTRVSDDIILTNVIGFDVKAFDSGAGEYKDLGYNTALVAPNQTQFNDIGNANSALTGTAATARVYDTYSTSHFNSIWNDGLDNGGDSGVVDDDKEKGNTVPPYTVPLRGIQVKIRVFEPDSKQIREVTVVQDFLSQ